MSAADIVVIVDYGLGNLNSVSRAVRAAGGEPVISSDPQVVAEATKLILPGVGAFEAGMVGLRERDLIEPLNQQVSAGTPLLGLCLGMQLLFTESEEFGLHQGLGYIPGRVKLLQPTAPATKIPHIGWNALRPPGKTANWKGSVLKDVKPGEMVYFVHSFVPHVKDPVHILAQTEYGGESFCSVTARANVTGTQFHPEKSGEVGQKILRQFLQQQKG